MLIKEKALHFRSGRDEVYDTFGDEIVPGPHSRASRTSHEPSAIKCGFRASCTILKHQVLNFRASSATFEREARCPLMCHVPLGRFCMFLLL